MSMKAQDYKCALPVRGVEAKIQYDPNLFYPIGITEKFEEKWERAKPIAYLAAITVLMSAIPANWYAATWGKVQEVMVPPKPRVKMFKLEYELKPRDVRFDFPLKQK
jgi:hypothetical protein